MKTSHAKEQWHTRWWTVAVGVSLSGILLAYADRQPNKWCVNKPNEYSGTCSAYPECKGTKTQSEFRDCGTCVGKDYLWCDPSGHTGSKRSKQGTCRTIQYRCDVVWGEWGEWVSTNDCECNP